MDATTDGLQLDSRAIIRRQRKRMKEMVLQRLRSANKILNYNDIIQEDPMPDLGGLLGSIGKFFEARRPLRPERKERQRNININMQQPKIVVSIRTAQNLPTRDNRLDDEVTILFIYMNISRWDLNGCSFDCSRNSQMNNGL